MYAVYNYCSNTDAHKLYSLAAMYAGKLSGEMKVLTMKEWMDKAMALGMPKAVVGNFTGHDEVFCQFGATKGARAGAHCKCFGARSIRSRFSACSLSVSVCQRLFC